MDDLQFLEDKFSFMRRVAADNTSLQCSRTRNILWARPTGTAVVNYRLAYDGCSGAAAPKGSLVQRELSQTVSQNRL